MGTQEQQDDTQEPTAEPSSNGSVPPTAERSPAEGRAAEAIQQWQKHIHVGEGAEACSDGENGRCKDSGHFHAFCRLPNPLQIKSVRDKANAAKARAIRQLKSPDADRHLILETDLETLREIASQKELVAEIMEAHRFRYHVDAVREIAEREEYEHIEEDQRRWQALSEQDGAERDQDEFDELTKQLEGWQSAVEELREGLRKPEHETLDQNSVDELIAIIREERIKNEAQEAWMSAYSLWEWYIGTLRPRDPQKGQPVERRFGSIEDLKAAPRGAVEAIEGAFDTLESSELNIRNQNAPRAEGNS